MKQSEVGRGVKGKIEMMEAQFKQEWAIRTLNALVSTCDECGFTPLNPFRKNGNSKPDEPEE